MPGLLQTQAEHFTKTKYIMALCAEFLGSMLFSFTGSALLSVALASPTDPNVVMAALGNAAGITVAVYCAANISGGHITPIVTIGTMAGLIPGSYVGMGDKGTGCFAPGDGVTKGMLFGWELILAFILVSTVYACAIGAPNFGNIAPLAVGVSLALDLMAGAAYSGGGVSPVRVLGPAIVFHCNWNTAWVYMLGEMTGGALAGALACPLYGDHAEWLDPFFPWGDKHHDKNVACHSAVCREETRYQQEHGHLPLPTDDSARNGGVSKDGDLTTIV
ncbi:MAG: hypothetical protein FRX49_11654 [Trebouxia sp. A1-2]|nr:MAG: hypothetical protein FRX49_11654 [Trebouxia sp. A1-2]